MDPIQQQWQQAFKQATPEIDVKALAAQVKTARRKEQFKAWGDLILGCAVSMYVLYVTIFIAQGLKQTLLFGFIAPVPAAFSVWMFILRRRQWRAQTDTISGMLKFKKQRLLLQEKYWRFNYVGMLVLWTGVLLLAAYNLYMGDDWLVWLIQILVNGGVLGAVWWRYRVIRKGLAKKLAALKELGQE